MTRLCVAIFVRSVEQAQRDIILAAENGADMVELRIDRFHDVAEIHQLLKSATVPCIVTSRPTWEGGEAELPDDERVRLLDLATVLATPYVDVELETLRRVPNVRVQIPRSLIVSAHDFKGRPERLYNIVAEMNAAGGSVNKIVWTARTVRDNLEAFELLLHKQKPTIALCMGEAGLISRVLAKKFGAFLTFASLDDSSGTAAGQVPVADVKRLYRWDAIGPRTRVYGVVGHPVAHSMSPAIHNTAFDRVGHDGVYLPLLVNPGYESFKAFMESFLAFAPLDLAGLSVTIPHKENALRYLKERGADVEELAERIGAVNTIVIERDGAPQSSVHSPQSSPGSSPRLRGINTDYAAILDTITSALGITREDLADKRVAVIGAGGTGRTAVAALAHCGATVVVYNRTPERAAALAREFDGKTGKVVSARMERLCDSCCHVFVNTTSLGMHPNVDASPFGQRLPAFEPGTLVFDTIYNPIETKLLRDARAAGAKTVGGIEMFVRQAVGQFESWTGQPAPVEVMRAVVEQRLRG